MMYKIFRRWISLAFLATALCGLVYLAVQQSLRQGANDPQIQMAEDAAAQLSTSTSTQGIVLSGAVNINESLAPYIIIYDGSGNPVAGNGMLDGSLAHLPSGVFSYVSSGGGEDRFTWQPRPDVREAVVIVPINGPNPGFVMAGRSLREVEIREDRARLEAFGVWFFVLGGLLILEIIFAAIESLVLRKARPSR